LRGVVEKPGKGGGGAHECKSKLCRGGRGKEKGKAGGQGAFKKKGEGHWGIKRGGGEVFGGSNTKNGWI